MPLISELHMRYAIQCDGCKTQLSHWEDDELTWFFDAEDVTRFALDGDWTREGVGLEERWHCPDCPPLGTETGIPPGQKNLDV